MREGRTAKEEKKLFSDGFGDMESLRAERRQDELDESARKLRELVEGKAEPQKTPDRLKGSGELIGLWNGKLSKGVFGATKLSEGGSSANSKNGE